MQFGISMFTSEGAVAPPELARATEGEGFDAQWFPDHTHLPVETRSIYPANPGNAPPVHYGEIYDVFIALTAAAVVTSRVKLGSAICVLPQRDPIIAAKQVASIDRLSGGRLRLGIGAGWSADEMANHGVDFKDRHTAMRERVEAMRAIWRENPAEYHGKTVNFTPLAAGPRPGQPGGPPVYVAGESDLIMQRVLRYGDGWISRARDLFPRGLVERVAHFRRLCEESGRGHLPVILLDIVHTPEDLDVFIKARVDEVVFVLRPSDAEGVAAAMKRINQMLRAAGCR